jgi:hypothetical protein
MEIVGEGHLLNLYGKKEEIVMKRARRLRGMNEFTKSCEKR